MSETVKLGIANNGDADGARLGENEAIEVLGIGGRPNPSEVVVTEVHP